jgi:hypothetical protein
MVSGGINESGKKNGLAKGMEMQGAARAVLPSRHTATALGAAEFPYNKGFISKNRLQISIMVFDICYS